VIFQRLTQPPPRRADGTIRSPALPV
jgi:hypothetical protein